MVYEIWLVNNWTYQADFLVFRILNCACTLMTMQHHFLDVCRDCLRSFLETHVCEKVWDIKKISLCVFKNKSSLLSHTRSVLRACFDFVDGHFVNFRPLISDVFPYHSCLLALAWPGVCAPTLPKLCHWTNAMAQSVPVTTSPQQTRPCLVVVWKYFDERETILWPLIRGSK